MCIRDSLPTRDDLDGVSLEPLLKDPDADWLHVAMTTYQRKNHAVRSQHYRYIRYADGSEEFYDHRVDPHEWNNLAGQAAMTPLIRQHAGWLPRHNITEARVNVIKTAPPKNTAPPKGSTPPDASGRRSPPASGRQSGNGDQVPSSK